MVKRRGSTGEEVPCIALSSGGLLWTRLRVRECKFDGDDEWLLLFGVCELSGAQGCGYGEGDEECERVVVVSKDESGVSVRERLRLRPAMIAGFGIAKRDGGSWGEEGG